MSYILDALKKADAQRESDPARGIHAQPLHGPAGAATPRGGTGPRAWGAAAVGVAALATASWYVFQQDDAATEPRVAASVQPPMPAARATPVAAPVVGAPALAAPVVLPAPMVAQAPASAIVPPAPPPMTRPFESPARDPRATSQPPMRGMPQPGSPGATPGAPQAGAPGAPQTATPGAPAAGGAVPAAPAPTSVPPQTAGPAQVPAPPPPVAMPVNPPPPAPVPPPVLPPAPPTPPVAGLPGDAPKIAISGGVYSSNAAQRMLIVNGQVFNEGSEIGPGVVLEEIKSKGSAVLRYRGSRYTVRY